jgi:hypothetical protein
MTLEQIDLVKAMCARYPADLALARVARPPSAATLAELDRVAAPAAR